MSIIMLASHQLVQGVKPDAEAFDLAVRSLLDHVAAELAEEYVRLMEAGAEAETETREPAAKDSPEEGTP